MNLPIFVAYQYVLCLIFMAILTSCLFDYAGISAHILHLSGTESVSYQIMYGGAVPSHASETMTSMASMWRAWFIR